MCNRNTTTGVNKSFRLSPERMREAKGYIKKLREEYLEAPTYFQQVDSSGLAHAEALDNKYLHRDWWREYYPETDFGGGSVNLYVDEIDDFVTELCAEQLGVQSKHEKLLEEDDTLYDYDDPSSYAWDESVAPNSTGSREVDDYAADLTDELVEEFRIEDAPEFTWERLDALVAQEEPTDVTEAE